MEFSAVILSLLATIISGMVAVYTVRKSQETQVQLENMRGEQQKQNAVNNRSRQRADILSRGSTLVQHLRDDIRDLGRLMEGEDPSSLLDKISRGCDALVDLYAHNHTQLADQGRRLLHNVKSQAKAILSACNKARSDPHKIEDLLAHTDSLTMLQSSIIAECEKWQDAAISGNEVTE